ncbi:MAG TPA: hypothetical protein PKD61_19870 [Polyangiaceae bacterium]|nr:hypothetical protein [Polyangiaceae bacterium]
MFRSVAIKVLACTSILALAAWAPRPAFAQAAPRDLAAEAFDAGVKHYERAEYAEAARAFLRANETLPSKDAIENALKSALRANDQLLVVAAARRALRREADAPELAARARDAMVQASAKLAILDLACSVPDCQIRIDGSIVVERPAYVLPGGRSLAAIAGKARAEERTRLEAGVRYQITLHPVLPGSAEKRAEVVPRSAASEEALPRTGDPAAPAMDSKADAAGSRPLSPTLFYVGVGASVVLAGITTWSGLDTLAAKSDLTSQSSKTQVDDVRGKALRTDVLLGTTVLFSALTTYAGVALVDWGVRPTASLSPGHILMGAESAF